MPPPPEPSRQFGADAFLRVGPAKPAGAKPEGAAGEARWEALAAEAAELAALFEAAERNLAGRIRMLRFAAALAAAEGDIRQAGLARLGEEQATLVRHLLRQLDADPRAGQQVAIALKRYDDAAALAKELGEAMARAAERPLGERLSALSGVDLKGLRRAIFLISTLDVHFAQVPIFADMFPAVARQAAPKPAAPAKGGKPTAPEPFASSLTLGGRLPLAAKPPPRPAAPTMPAPPPPAPPPTLVDKFRRWLDDVGR